MALLLGIGLFTGFAVDAQASTTVQWYLTDEVHSMAEADGDLLIMSTESPGPDSEAQVTIQAGECQSWAAEQQVQVDRLEFDKTGWTGEIMANEDLIQGQNDGSGPHASNLLRNNTGMANAMFLHDGQTTFSEGEQANHDPGDYASASGSGTFELFEGDVLVWELCNQGDKTMKIHTDGHSFIQTPSDSPAYPTPEVGTLVMTLAGLVAIVGVVRLQGRT